MQAAKEGVGVGVVRARGRRTRSEEIWGNN